MAEEERKMEVILPISEKQVANEIMRFLNELNKTEQENFMTFLLGARFGVELSKSSRKEETEADL